jgi:hypothetical protein
MQGGKNWIFPKEMNANRFFWDSHWLEIWSNHFCPSMGPNGGSVAKDYGGTKLVTNQFDEIPRRSTYHCLLPISFGKSRIKPTTI